MAKSSKKATAAIVSLVQAIDPSKSKLISFDEAWEVISSHANLVGELTHSLKNGVIFSIYKSEKEDLKLIDKLTFESKDVFAEGDWDWTMIFKTVIEHVMKNKIVKKPRAKKNNVKDVVKPSLKRAETKQISQISSKVTKSTPKPQKSVKSQINKSTTNKNKIVKKNK